MGEYSVEKEKKKRCCLNCHYLSKHYYSANMDVLDFRTWNEAERSQRIVKNAKVVCAESEWSKEDEDDWKSSHRNLLTIDRSECTSYEEFDNENRSAYIERFRQAKKEKRDRNRYMILAIIGLAGLVISWIGLYR